MSREPVRGVARQLPGPVRDCVAAYLRVADRAFPGRVAGLYVVGSVALGAYQHGRSDIDLVVVLDGRLDASDIRRLRLVQVASGARTGGAALARGRTPTAGTCNAVFVDAADLTMPVSRISPIAAHIGHELVVGGAGSDVSPVAWKTLAEHGIAVRGPQPAALGLDPEPDTLVAWNLANLDSYWRPWAQRMRGAPVAWFGLRPRWSTAWGVLGAPRLLCTVATGEIVAKEDAGRYARAVMAPRWHPIIDDAIAYRVGRTTDLSLSRADRAVWTADFVDSVLAHADAVVAGT